MEKIKPLKDKLISDCLLKQKSLKHCNKYYRDYGENRSVILTTKEQDDLPTRQAIPGLFWGIPICEKAQNIEKFFFMYPSKEIYTE